MGGVICAVNGCYNYFYQKNRRSFFKMPKHVETLKQWIEACNRKDLDELLVKTDDLGVFHKKYVLCSDHFEMHCFRNKTSFSQGLIPGAVPTLKLNHNSENTIKVKEEVFDETKCKEIKKEPEDVEIEDNIVSEERIKLEQSNLNYIEDITLNQESQEDSHNNSFHDHIQTELKITKMEAEITKLKDQLSICRRKVRNKSNLLNHYKRQNRILKQQLINSQEKKKDVFFVKLNNVIYAAKATE